MEQPHPRTEDRFFVAFQRPAWVVMMVAQMLLGLALAIALVVKYYMLVMGTAVCTPDGETLGNIIRCTATLEIVAHFVLAMAGFRFAAFMFQDRPRAMLGALMLALGGVFLLFLTGITADTASWPVAAVLVSLMLGISLIIGAQVILRKPTNPQNKSDSVPE